MNKSIFYFKVASGFLLLLGALHTFFDQFSRLVNKEEMSRTNVFNEMSNYQIQLFGTHTLYEFYSGFSIAMGMLLMGYGLLNLIVVKHIIPNQMYRITILNVMVCLIMLIISSTYFHLLANFMLLISLVGYGVSYQKGRVIV